MAPMDFIESTINKHIWETRLEGQDFDLLKEIGASSFSVNFHTYYDDVVFGGFIYKEQIELLIKALHP